jgi:hypothetical protein
LRRWRKGRRRSRCSLRSRENAYGRGRKRYSSRNINSSSLSSKRRRRRRHAWSKCSKKSPKESRIASSHA